MSRLTLEAKLERQESTTPWGFRMQGGKDFSSPLTIARVTPGSLAAKCGLQQGDIILKIGNNGSDTLKHKDAQDAILSYGNKLDLLLQRLDYGRPQGGAPTYETFSTPSISSYQNPASAPSGGSSSYNTAPKPFASSAAPTKPSPAPYSSSAEINLSQQTQNLNISTAPSYSKYSDVDDKPNQSTQSRSFKFLQDTLESGHGKPSQQSQAPPPWASEQQAPPPPPPAPPAPVQSRAPPAPKPGVWTPGQPAGGVHAAKPFVPTVAPPAPGPAAPRSAPPKPSGVGAMRGKIGDAVIKSDATRIPVCASCGSPIRGPFVTAMGKCWCPDHFICANPRCGNKLIDIGFVEEGGFLYCEKDYELYFAPHCAKCDGAIIGECVNALNKQYHPACFLCFKCNQPIGGNQFHLEDGHAYCENDWRQMFQTMCSACDFPIEPGDKWVEALSSNFHSECFNCSTCQVNLEGQAFYAKGGKPFCKKHAR